MKTSCMSRYAFGSIFIAYFCYSQMRSGALFGNELHFMWSFYYNCNLWDIDLLVTDTELEILESKKFTG